MLFLHYLYEYLFYGIFMKNLGNFRLQFRNY